MNTRLLLSATCASLLLCACAPSEPAAPPEASPQDPKALQRTIQEPLDKARAVESQMQQHRQDLDQQLDDAGG